MSGVGVLRSCGWRRLLCVPAIGASVLWAGCSVEKNYKLLSFFFDGVPDPSAPRIMASSGSAASMRASPTYSAHFPFLNGQCVQCHGQGFTMQGVDVAVCVTCHEGAKVAYEYMHGPVAFGACLVCHVAHESEHAYLLKSTSRDLCEQCHVTSMLSAEPVAEHQDETVSCLDCHVGHGASHRFLPRDTPLIKSVNKTPVIPDGVED